MSNVARLRQLKQKAMRQMMLPIYSKCSGQWQMDTLEQSGAAKKYKTSECPPYYLILINVNTRKAYAYPMMGKDEQHVIKALNQFVRKEKWVKELYTDDDSAYKGRKMDDWYDKNGIDHDYTRTENKYTLGIINRFIRTLRDAIGDRDINTDQMDNFINKYNNAKHDGTGIVPNKMTVNQEKKYIMDQYEREQAIKAATMLDTTQSARTFIDRKAFDKRRMDYEETAYPITALKGKVYQMKHGNKNILVPRWKLRVDDRQGVSKYR